MNAWRRPRSRRKANTARPQEARCPRRTTARPPRRLLAALALVAAACSREPDLVPPRHVVLLVVDTLRADHLGCYGYARPTSPAIDALAREGVRFENAVAQSSWTSPSMASMLSSRYVAEDVVAIPDDRPTLAERFRSAGFETAAFVNNDILDPENGFQRGFELYDYEKPPYGSDQPFLDWLAERRNARTFTWIHLAEPHDEGGDYAPPDAFRKWRHAKEGLARERLDYYDAKTAELGLVERGPSLERIESGTGAYDDDVACADARVGAIVEGLKRLGVWDETALVLAADHGEGLWAYEQFPIGTRKTARERGDPPTLVNTMHQTHGSHVRWELVHVPLLLRAPGLDPAVVAPFVENVDIAPTLLALCRVQPIEDAHGRSLLPLAADPDRREGLAPAAFTYTMYNASLISQDGRQLVLPTALGECEFDAKPELYDVLRDRESRKNLIAGEGRRVAELEALLHRHLEEGLRRDRRPIGSKTLDAMAGLGYLGTGMVDELREELEGLATDELIAKAGDAANCLVRLEAIRMLRSRELSPEQRAALDEAGARGSSKVVRRQVDALLRE